MKENYVYFINIEPNNRNLGVFKHVKLNEENKFYCGHFRLFVSTL